MMDLIETTPKMDLAIQDIEPLVEVRLSRHLQPVVSTA